MSSLKIFRDGRLQQVVSIEDAELTIGSQTDRDLVLEGEGVAARHAILRSSDGRWEIFASDARARFLINGVTTSKSSVKSGDTVELGPFKLLLDLDPVPRAQAPAQSPMPDLVLAARPAAPLDASRALKQLFRATRRLGSRINSGELLENMMDCLLEVFGAERGFILLADGTGGSLEPAIARRIDPADVRGTISSTVSQRVLAEKKPLLVMDGDVEAWARQAPSILREQLRSIICAPLAREDGSVIGVVYLDSRVSGRSYTEEDLDLLDAFGHYSVIAIEGARERDQLRRDFDHLKALNLETVLEEHNFENIIHRSPAMTQVLEQVKAVAAQDVTAVILGESGTGKELIARAIHHRSRRSGGPFVAINCMALSPELIESELFGHEKGAFSGAVSRRAGRFELADGGTLLLDEVGELPASVQGKLLRVLQEGELERVGGTQTVRVDVRILGATHKDLRHEVASGAFREDLYYRINVFSLSIPSLRERRDDIPLLVRHFIDVFNKKMGRGVRGINADAFHSLVSYAWPGNVRELRNVMERAFVLEKTDLLSLASLPLDLAQAPVTSTSSVEPSAITRSGNFRIVPMELKGSAPEPRPGSQPPGTPFGQQPQKLSAASKAATGGETASLDLASLPRDFQQAMTEFERLFLREAIRRNNGNLTEAARELGISRRHIYRRIEALGL